MSGITIQPGESGEMDLPPQVGALYMQYGARFTLWHGPVTQSSPGNYQRRVELLVDGKAHGEILLRWWSPPAKWWQRVWDRITGKPPSSIVLELPPPPA